MGAPVHPLLRVGIGYNPRGRHRDLDGHRCGRGCEREQDSTKHHSGTAEPDLAGEPGEEEGADRRRALGHFVGDRMPVIVPRELFDPWLAGENVALGPYPAGAMKVQPVSTLVNKPSSEVHRRAPGPRATLAFGVAPDVRGHPRAGQREVADRRAGAFRIRWRPPRAGGYPSGSKKAKQRLQHGDAR